MTRFALLLAVAAVLALSGTALGHEAAITGHTDCDGGWAKATAIDITPDRMVVVTSTISPSTESPAGTTGYSGTVVVWEQSGTYPFEGQVTMAIYRPGRHGSWVLESHDKLTLEAPSCPIPTSTATPTPTVPSTPTPTPTSRTIPSPTPTGTPSASPTSSPTPTATSSSTAPPTSPASSPTPTPPATSTADPEDRTLYRVILGGVFGALIVLLIVELLFLRSLGRRR